MKRNECYRLADGQCESLEQLLARGRKLHSAAVYHAFAGLFGKMLKTAAGIGSTYHKRGHAKASHGGNTTPVAH